MSLSMSSSPSAWMSAGTAWGSPSLPNASAAARRTAQSLSPSAFMSAGTAWGRRVCPTPPLPHGEHPHYLSPSAFMSAGTAWGSPSLPNASAAARRTACLKLSWVAIPQCLDERGHGRRTRRTKRLHKTPLQVGVVAERFGELLVQVVGAGCHTREHGTEQLLTGVVGDLEFAPACEAQAHGVLLPPRAGDFNLNLYALPCHRYHLLPVECPLLLYRIVASVALTPSPSPTGWERGATLFALTPDPSPTGWARGATLFALTPGVGEGSHAFRPHPQGWARGATLFALTPSPSPTGWERGATLFALTPSPSPTGYPHPSPTGGREV
jgi:hypothetical protein